MTALVFYLLAIVVVGIGISRARSHDTGPVWCWWVAAFIAGLTAYYGQSVGGPIGLLSGVVLHVAMPILLLITGGFALFYAWEAMSASFGVSIFGWQGQATAPGNNATWKQWDVALILFIAGIASIVVGLSFGGESLSKAWNSLPAPAGRPAAERTVAIAERLKPIREEKPLRAANRPFAITLYPEDFLATRFDEDMKSAFDPKIAHLGVKVKDFIQLRVEEMNEGVDLIGHFTTESILEGAPVPVEVQRMTVRVAVQTPDGVDAWVEQHVLPRVQALLDDAVARGTVDAEVNAEPKKAKPRNGIVLPEPDDSGIIGGEAP